ncbi:MAG: hypothetical protein PF487_03665 [Bacteroidales bacterium]|nr:hypothetical protein [Bacteroidales bacterium]
MLFVIIFLSCENENLDNISDIRNKIEGQWSVQEDSELLKSTNITNYTVYISPSETDTSNILIDNFYQIGWGIEAEGEIRNEKIYLTPYQEINTM